MKYNSTCKTRWTATSVVINANVSTSSIKVTRIGGTLLTKGNMPTCRVKFNRKILNSLILQRRYDVILKMYSVMVFENQPQIVRLITMLNFFKVFLHPEND